MVKKEKGNKKTEVEKETKGGSQVQDAIREIKTKFGDDSIMTLGEAPRVDVGVIPTGSLRYLVQSQVAKQHSPCM